MGRTSLRSTERDQAILNALRAGNTRRAAAAFAEVSHATFYRWLEDDGTFRDAVEKAEAEAEVRFLTQIAKAATDGTWQAAAWWLERRRTSDYGRTMQSVELTGKDGGPVEVARPLTDHESLLLRQAIDRELAERGADGS